MSEHQVENAAGDLASRHAALARPLALRALGGYLEGRRLDRQASGAVLSMTPAELAKALAADPALVRFQVAETAAIARAAEQAELTMVLQHDAAYPEGLDELPSAPGLLFLAGDRERFVQLCAAPCVAVVGGRKASSYGLSVAHELGRQLSLAGVTVVSGMALGVDSAAHTGAIAAGGNTIAVMPSGADRAYPTSKRGLHRQITAVGAVISEFPPGMRPHKWCFPARNRIIAALSKLTVVIEAAERSGALITAGWARDLGRDVGAVPGEVTAHRSRGSNSLLHDGAHVIRDARDVLDIAIGPGYELASKTLPQQLSAGLREIVEAVEAGDQTLAALCSSGRDSSKTAAALAELELEGLIQRGGGGEYTVVPHA